LKLRVLWRLEREREREGNGGGRKRKGIEDDK
jgi:hypothetical protein